MMLEKQASSTQSASPDAAYYAFFDVDGTVINRNSLLNFLNHVDREMEAIDDSFADFRRALYRKLVDKEPRQEVNRFYFRYFKNKAVADLHRRGREWFASLERQDGFYNAAMLKEIEMHRQNKAHIVFVTGSFPSLLMPLAEKVGAHHILCSTPCEQDGVFTGELVGQSCIGEGKAQRMLAFAAEHDVDLEACHAYGDDDSDIPMLNLVGYPHRIMPSEAYLQDVKAVVQNLKDRALTAVA